MVQVFQKFPAGIRYLIDLCTADINISVLFRYLPKYHIGYYYDCYHDHGEPHTVSSVFCSRCLK